MKNNNNYSKNPDVKSGLRPERRGIIWVGIALSLFFFLIFVFTKDIKIQEAPPSLSTTDQSPVNKGEDNQTFLEINNKKIATKIAEGKNVYDFMQKLQKEGKINFRDSTYIGMGKLIEEINGVKNNGNKNWIYYVNGKKAEIGISNYKLKTGDVVSWKYEDYY